MISLAGLNDPQRQAASTIEGPLLILAGAGSGKTRTITYRIAHMVDNLGIPGKSILGVSFTNKAAKEMRERVIGLLGKRKARGLTLATFHSLGVKILKKEIEHLGRHKNFSIYDTSDQLAIIREALKNFHDEKGNFDQKTILSKIGHLKNNGISEEEFADSEFFDPDSSYDHATEHCYRFYQDKLLFYNAIDFDDILFLTVKLFTEHPEVAKAWSENFQYIMIDEYQDTNPLQLQLVLSLTSTHQNICVVGDDDQAIYSFRGADIRNILSFEKNFPCAKVVKLEENYRSTSPILKLANRVIEENKDRRDKTLWSKKESNFLPLLWSTADSDHEAQIVVESIVKHQSEGGHLGDIAILYRSNTQAKLFEDELRLSHVPYTIIGGQKFYDKKEVKDLIAYLCFISNHRDELSLRRIINIPSRGIGLQTLQRLLSLSQSEKIPLYEAIKKCKEIEGITTKRADALLNFVDLIERTKEKFKLSSLSESISTFVEEINYLNFIEKQHDNAKQVERRKNDISMFIESAERFSKFKNHNTDLKEFIERLLLQDSQDMNDLEDEEDQDVRKNQVTMMTFHSSKGLEFRQVYMVGVEEETLPHKKTIREGQDISEERRLCYVGITRAQEKLYMTYCKEREIYGAKTPRYPSRFIAELEKEKFLVVQDCTTFGHLGKVDVEEYKFNFFEDLISNLD